MIMECSLAWAVAGNGFSGTHEISCRFFSSAKNSKLSKFLRIPGHIWSYLINLYLQLQLRNAVEMHWHSVEDIIHAIKMTFRGRIRQAESWNEMHCTRLHMNNFVFIPQPTIYMKKMRKDNKKQKFINKIIINNRSLASCIFFLSRCIVSWAHKILPNAETIREH